MDNPAISQIIASLESKSLPELRDLADALARRYVPAPAEDETQAREKEARSQAYWTPYYKLILVSTGHDPNEPGNTVRICKALRELIPGLGLLEAKRMVDDAEALPMTVVTVLDEHPAEVRKRLRPVREELEALGFVFEEDYQYGYFD